MQPGQPCVWQWRPRLRRTPQVLIIQAEAIVASQVVPVEVVVQVAAVVAATAVRVTARTEVHVVLPQLRQQVIPRRLHRLLLLRAQVRRHPRPMGHIRATMRVRLKECSRLRRPPTLPLEVQKGHLGSRAKEAITDTLCGRPAR